MKDLLGANYHTDIDKYSMSDYGKYSFIVQNNLDNPNRKIYEGDRFEYDYDIFVNKAQLWLAHTFTKSRFSSVLSANITGETLERVGNYRNGRSLVIEDGKFVKDSKGSSGVAKFLAGGAKLQLGYSINAHHNLSLAGGFDMRPPLAYNAFVAPRVKNDYVSNLTNEYIAHAEAAYKFAFGPFSGKLTGYYARFNSQVEQTAFYDDMETRFTYLTMSGVNKEHYGAELALLYNITSNFSLHFIGTLSEARYTNNPLAELTYDNAAEVTNFDETHKMPLRVVADGMRINGTPLTALNFGAKYSINGWFFEANLNYYDRVYCDFSRYRHLTKSMTSYAPMIDANGNNTWGVDKATLNQKGGLLLNQEGQLVKAYSPSQEKFDGGFMLDASIGRFIRLEGGKAISINLSVQNITNNRNLRTGGYEQNRDDNYSTGEQRPYVFSKNSKYYYANPINAFLNVNYRF